MQIGILGGGFGLYGYLPAAIQNGYEVSTLTKYKPFLNSRPELTQILKDVNFVTEEDALLNGCRNMIMARDPQSQADFLSQRSGQYQKLFLEKPLGANVRVHEDMLNLLTRTNQLFSIGYLVPFTNWFKNLDLEGNFSTEIHWQCVLNQASWKANSFVDKGLFTFFGVHLIPIFAEIKPLEIEIEVLDAGKKINFYLMTGSGIYKFFLSAGNESWFRIVEKVNSLNQKVINLQTPFGDRGKSGIADPRISLLSDYLKFSYQNSSKDSATQYERLFISLSKRIESILQDK